MNFRAIKSWQWVLIVMALLVALDWAIRRSDPRSRELNHILETQASQKLKDYPYQFQVLRVEGNRTTLLVAFESTAADQRRAHRNASRERRVAGASRPAPGSPIETKRVT